MKNLRRLACKFDLNQSERKSTQVHARPGQTESQGDPSSQLAATRDSVWPGLKIFTRFPMLPNPPGVPIRPFLPLKENNISMLKTPEYDSQ